MKMKRPRPTLLHESKRRQEILVFYFSSWLQTISMICDQGRDGVVDDLLLAWL